MTLVKKMKSNDSYHISLWNKCLISSYIILYFLNNVTRYKNCVVILMYITAIYYLIKNKIKIFDIVKNNLTISLGLFSVSIVYSISISIDPSYSLKKFFDVIFSKILVISFIIPIILYSEKKEEIAKLFIYSLIISIIPIAITDFWQYIKEYNVGIMPFTDYEHKYKSDALIFIAPTLLFLWKKNTIKIKIIVFLLSLIVGFMILGTMQRGTWLSIIVPTFIWCILKKEWKLPTIAIIVLSLFLSIAYVKNHEQFNTLFYKLQQTSSSHRYAGGTQGSAMDLILENPIKGYGFGDNVFHKVYNDRIKDYPQWVFRESIGPHNITLSIWFSAGLLGLVAFWYMLIILIRNCICGFKNDSSPIVKECWLLILLILIGDYIIRGAFETVYLGNIAMLMGFSIILKIKDE
ncbi:ligase [Leminorella grimontii]|uniref:Ligase n=1 Tax=Leminorella grimontii TaxID=82981 RepID=A0AAV5N8I9_9GAMM|nr:O-antigen ligase RfaL [Leminorella grimontii]GKX57188.1 ligase [Leminorella grimontii]